MVACQPPSSNNNRQPNENSEQTDSPIVISADSVTMAPGYILNIKPSRYQPSLGLQGVIEPIKQSRFVAAHHLTVQKVLVKEGQWVEKGTPLLIVQRQSASYKPAATAITTDTKAELKVKEDSLTTQSTQPQPDSKVASNNKKISDKPLDNFLDMTQGRTEQSDSKPNISTQAPNNSPPTNIDPANNDAVNSKEINSNKANNKQQATLSAQPITVRASFSGRVDTLYVQVGQQMAARTPLLRLSDDKDLRFIATLPIEAEPQLSVGQTVNFTTAGLLEKFTGQVSKLAGDPPNQLLVYVHVINNEASRGKLKPDMAVTGRVDYGQIEVGTIVPKHAIHDADLTELQTSPYKPLTPLTANVWIIQQNQRLARQPVEVIEYDPSTGQYLIAGISNDSLICLAELPSESAGKKVVVSK